jgi:hypothetical protein
MGYDMTIAQERDQAEKDAIAAARKHIDTLTSPHKAPEGEERDAAEKAWKEAWQAYDNADRSYFRLNIWGMGRCRTAMDHLGMVTDEDAPNFPTPEDFGLSEYPEDPVDYDGDERAAMDAKLTDADRQFLAAVKAVTDFEPEPVRGIPIGKFGSNDGWLVTPRQIEAALKTWHGWPEHVRADTEAELAWWPEWIAFLTYAQGRGGFRVY